MLCRIGYVLRLILEARRIGCLECVLCSFFLRSNKLRDQLVQRVSTRGYQDVGNIRPDEIGSFVAKYPFRLEFRRGEDK